MSTLGPVSRPTKILLVDDERDFLDPVAFQLKAEGYAVVATTDSLATVKLVDAEAPDVVVLDNRMPGADGPETLKEIRKRHPGLPVIIMTAFIEDTRSDEVNSCGPTGIYYKGEDTSVMMELIRSALKK